MYVVYIFVVCCMCIHLFACRHLRQNNTTSKKPPKILECSHCLMGNPPNLEIIQKIGQTQWAVESYIIRLYVKSRMKFCCKKYERFVWDVPCVQIPFTSTTYVDDDRVGDVSSI